MGLFSKRAEERSLHSSPMPLEEMAQAPKLLTFEEELSGLINKYSLESLSNTPDFILAYYLKDCLLAFNNASQRRAEWLGMRSRHDEEVRASRPAPLS